MKKIEVWGHRGASGYYPENTMLAFEKAIEMGVDGIELDIQLTKDKRMVVCHDEKIDRTSYGHGWLKDYTLEELRQFNFNNGMNQFGKVDIPLIEDVLDLCKQHKVKVNIELKTGVFDYEGMEKMICEMVEEKEMINLVVFSSFNHYTIKNIQHLNPNYRVAYLYQDGLMNIVKYALTNGVKILHPWVYNLRYDGFMDECNKHGIEVNTWTVNSIDDIDFCMKKGVHAMIGNYPDLIMERLKNE